jgi:hypothetical protein
MFVVCVDIGRATNLAKGELRVSYCQNAGRSIIGVGVGAHIHIFLFTDIDVNE